MDEELTVRALARPLLSIKRAMVRVVDGPDRGQEALLEAGKTVGIGVSTDNELRLRDVTVSRYHAELRLEKGELLVRDLESLNGTYLGDVRIDRAAVTPGTSLRLGSNTVRIDSEESGATASIPPHDEPRVPGLIARSLAMRHVAQTIGTLAGSNVSVLLHGETGTGKEVLARALHEMSPRRNRPFEVVDCGSMAPTLIASELFGHERGAFTGAHGERPGAFERADGGTVFLDEVGELPLELQPMLLGVLERRRFKRVGGSKERAIDVRVVSATHRDLRKATNVGTFRADLYFRLAVARVVIPALRERPEDIEPLVQHFAEQLTGDPHANPFDAAALDALAAHPWSGNVRELRNVVESAIAMGTVTLDGRALSTNSKAEPDALADVGSDLPYRDARSRAINAFEQRYLGRLIEACDGNASEAARRAKMDRPYLLSLLRKHALR